MSEWREYRLSEVIEKFIDYRGKTPTKTAHGIPLITAKIVKEGKILEANEFIAEKDYDSWMTRGLPEINDVVLTTEAPLGEVALIKDKKVALAQRIITLRGKKDKINNVFLKYYFQSKDGQHELQSRASGTTVFGIKSSVLQEIPILLPPLAEQKAIAGVLSALDDKIDLLHRQNKTLEAMAEALFRQWFVEEAEESWEEGRLGDLVETNIASIDSKFELNEIRYLDTGSVTEGKIESFQEIKLVDAPSRARRLIKHNDILYSTVRPNQKHYCIIKNPGKDIVVSTGFCVISCTKIDPHFVYLLLTSDEMTDYLHSIAEGSTSTYPSLKPSDIESIDLLIPPQKKLKDFSEIVDNSWSKIDENYSQIRSLEKLRDTLLPKLMSGEVRVEV